jgi:hypothetical protein
MAVHLYGLDWEAYGGLVMPAFARWLLHGTETPVYELYQQTRCAREEQYIPAVMRTLCTWPRAESFVRQLPRSGQICAEYRVLCCAEEFTRLNDRYMHQHIPQLYPVSDALRAVWGAIVEKHCQSCLTVPDGEAESNSIHMDKDEHETSGQGVSLGSHPAPLHLRGWLAARSVRAMALFELLACGRRCMPFGSRAGEPYESYIGYLTPIEVKHMADCLCHETRCPTSEEAEADYTRFRLATTQDFRMIDEVLPVYAAVLLQVVRMAARDGSGLICRIDQ